MKRSPIVGVMGGGSAAPSDMAAAERPGRLIAEAGWILLTGGRAAGIMEAAARGAARADGITVGVLPDADRSGMSSCITIPVVTGMGNARNCINVLTSDVVIACPGGAGTISEIALSLKTNTPVVLMNFDIGDLFAAERDQRLFSANGPEAATAIVRSLIEEGEK